MKVFLVFIALFMINLTFVVYESDLGRYILMQRTVKAAAEECAAGASLFYDAEEYSEGRYVFLYEESIKHVEYLLSEMQKKHKLYENLSYDIAFEDDLQGYESKQIPSVLVGLTVTTPDLFRLPFFTVTNIQRISKYELPNWK